MPNLIENLEYAACGQAPDAEQTLYWKARNEILRLQKIEAAARDLMDNSPIGDNDKPYSSDVAGREFDALYLSLQPKT